MIRTQRLLLRQFHESDLEALHRVVADKMASQWSPYDAQWPLDRESLKNTLCRICTQNGWYAVEYDGELIGFIAAQPADNGRSCEIGYTIRSDMQRKGFAYEACAAIMRELAMDSTLERFTAGTAECNYPSIALLTKLGFSPKLRHRAWFKKDENGSPMWFMGYSFECNAEVWRK